MEEFGFRFASGSKIFYFTTKESANLATYLLKDMEGHVIRKFEGSRISLIRNEDNLPLILVQLSPNSNTFDNVYLFDGQSTQLINKNLKRYDYEFLASGYSIIPKVADNQSFRSEYFPLKSIADGSEKKIEVLHPFVNLWGTASVDKFTIVGTAGENIVYLYNDPDYDPVLEVFSVKTGERKTLAKGKGISGDVFQILYSGDKKILRLFKDKSLDEEFAIRGEIPVSKYDDKESTYIDLSTLEELSLNPKDFNKLIINGASQYSVEKMLNVTYNLFHLKNAVDKNKFGRLLF